MKTISRYIMTLALLLMAVTGAWAQDTYTVQFKANGNTKVVENITLPHTFGCTWNDELGRGTGELDVIIQELYGLDGGTCASNIPESDNASVTSGVDDGDNQYIIVNAPFNGTATVTGFYFNSSLDQFNYSLEITCVDPNADPNAITVEPGSSANTWTFTMPAYDVEIAPIYAPVAQWAKVDNVDQLPIAIEGIYAESTDAIVKAGTVAKIGETDNVQGTLMYAVSTSDTEQPAPTAFSATLPTAKDITTAGDVYVWYYIKGADTPQGETATAENTFNDSEICTTPLTVTVLNNKFDIQFNAANANTIEAGKATVTVGGTDKTATVTEGKLEGVKMGSEVKLEAKPGYKFRKVEVKKGGGAKPLANATTEDLGKVIGADGNIYANKDAAETANTTAVAMICYVVEGHGLALALTDEVDKMNWSTAQTTCDAHTPAITGGKWMLASKGEWNNMISAAGSYSALRDGFSSVGGTNMQSEGYWSSTEDDSSDAWNYYFSNGLWSDVSKNWNRCVRACLAF